MYTITTRFVEVKAKTLRKDNCSVCGKRTARSRTFTQTVSPFNKVADKSRPKTYAEVQAAVNAQAAAWDPPASLFDHDTCTEGVTE